MHNMQLWILWFTKLKNSRHEFEIEIEIEIENYLHAGFIPIVAESDVDETLFFGEDCLIDVAWLTTQPECKWGNRYDIFFFSFSWFLGTLIEIHLQLLTQR